MVPIHVTNPGVYLGNHDPLRNYYFNVLIDGKPIRGISKISTLMVSTETILYRAGGENDRDHRTPGRTSYHPITLERPLTTDRCFEDWASMIYQRDNRDRDVDYRRDMQIEILDLRLRPILRYNLYGCWVSKYSISDLDSSANELATEFIRVEIDSWELDRNFVPNMRQDLHVES